MGGDILILDDDADLRDALAEFIELAAGRRVWKATSVAELAALGSQALACKLAILDVNLGRDLPSGLDALRWFTERKFCGRVVFLTGHALTFPPVEEARARSDVELLLKPLSNDQLLALLESSQ